MATWKAFRLFGVDFDFRRGTIDTLGTLLPEIFGRIFALLDFPSSAAVSRVCKSFNARNNTNLLWAERLDDVKKRCVSLIAMEVLPADYALDYLSRMLDLPGKVTSEFIGTQTSLLREWMSLLFFLMLDRLHCRILMTALIVLPFPRKSDSAADELKTLCKTMPGAIRYG